MKYLQTLLNLINRTLTSVAALLLGGGVVFMCVEIGARYFFGIAHDWGDAMIQAGVVCAYLLIAGPNIRSDSHTKVDMLLVSLSDRKRAKLELLLSLISLLFLLLLLVSSIQLVQTLKQYQLVEPTTLYTPTWVIYLPLPIGIAACILFALEKVISKLHLLISSALR